MHRLRFDSKMVVMNRSSIPPVVSEGFRIGEISNPTPKRNYIINNYALEESRVETVIARRIQATHSSATSSRHFDYCTQNYDITPTIPIHIALSNSSSPLSVKAIRFTASISASRGNSITANDKVISTPSSPATPVSLSSSYATQPRFWLTSISGVVVFLPNGLPLEELWDRHRGPFSEAMLSTPVSRNPSFMLQTQASDANKAFAPMTWSPVIGDFIQGSSPRAYITKQHDVALTLGNTAV